MRLVTTVWFVLALGAAAAGPVMAVDSPSASLTWDQCAADGGTLLRTFDCNANTGVDELVCSFVAPPDIPDLVGVEALVAVILCGQPSWWQVWGSGACRANSLTLDLLPPDNASACVDTWQGRALGSINLTYQYNPNYDYSYGRLSVALAVPPQAATALTEGGEYFAFRLRINHAKTLGTGACPGCGNPAALVMSELVLYRAGAPDAYHLYGPREGPAYWQSTSASSCIPDAVHGRTWGAIKNLYR